MLTYFVTDLGGKAIFFLIPILAAGSLGQERFGSYALALTVVYMFTVAIAQATNQPFIVLAGEEQKQSQKANTSFTSRLILIAAALVLSTVVFFLGRDVITEYVVLEEVDLVYIVLAIVGVSLRFFWDSMFLALRQKVLYGAYSLTGGLFGLGYYVYLLATNTLSVNTLLASFLVANFFGAVVLLPFAKLDKLFPLKFDWENLKKLTNYMSWFVFGLLAVYVVNWGDNIVLRDNVSLQQIGVYNFAYQFFKGFVLLATSVVTFLLPGMVKNLDNPKYVSNFINKSRWQIVFLWTGMVVVINLALTIFVNVFYADKYAEAIPILWLLAIAAVSLIYRRLYEPLFNAQKRFAFVHIVNVIFVATNVILNLILIPSFGISGAAIATAVAYTVVLVIYEGYFRVRVKPNLETSK